MPYKNKDDKLAAQRRWYASNREAAVADARERQAAYRQRNVALVDLLLADVCQGCGSTDERHLQVRRAAADQVARKPASLGKVMDAIQACPDR